MVNGKCVDKEPNTLVVSFLEMLSTRSKTAVADKNAIHISLCTRNKGCMSYNVVHPKMFACSALLEHHLKSWHVFKFAWVCLHVCSES